MLSDRLPSLIGTAAGPQRPRAVVFRPRAGTDLSALAGYDLQIIQGFKPDHDAFAARGFEVRVAPTGRFDLAVVCLPRAKAQAQALIAEASACAPRVIVDGQKTDGIDSLLKACRKRVGVEAVTAKAHGKAFAFAAGDLSDWVPAGRRTVQGGFVTAPGVFSADGIDPASAALVAALPDVLPPRIVDLGAGWGFITRHVLDRRGVREVHLVEAEHAALECARLNVADERAVFHWADATRFALPEPVDMVVTNPPFHTSRAADPALGAAFIAAAARLLRPGGMLWLVSNRHLPYEAPMAAEFGNCTEMGGTSGFKVLTARKALRTTGSRA